MKLCFLFGHSDCPDRILSELESQIELAVSKGVLNFYVGNRGTFDRLAATAVKRIKEEYPGVRLYLLLSYHPAERSPVSAEGFDGTYYPLDNTVPRKYAIVRANETMLRQVNYVICYVNHVGNTRKLLKIAKERQERGEIQMENIAEMDISLSFEENGEGTELILSPF